MQVLVSIDDTDNLDTDIGTGEIATMISCEVEERKWGKSERVTRHQLLVHPDIPYTSHNSSMCFAADLDLKYLNDLTKFAGSFLDSHSAAGSDPGLCIVVPDRLQDRQDLIDFGFKAKKQVLTKEEAYRLAKALDIHLSEHGGTGQGIIGALAGAGLRLSGNDGRLKGKLNIRADSDIISAGKIRTQSGVDLVKNLYDETVLRDDELVRLGDTPKAVLLKGKVVMLVFPLEGSESEAQWQTCSKSQLKIF